ncbi:MAG: hypothetical protein HKN70_07240 [Gammaproteobacteria bacterium]|nr:hypothetical protein [Gammaproteobacteria bacterium]
MQNRLSLFYMLTGLLALPTVTMADANIRASAPEAHEYTVQVRESLDALDVRAQFSHPVTAVKLDDAGARRHVRALRHCDSDRSLPFIRGSIDAAVFCIEYTVRLKNIRGRAYGSSRYSHIKDRITTPGQWMLLPASSRDNIQVNFTTPPGINVSVPWKNIDGDRFEYGRYSLSADAITAFGRFEKIIIPVSGGELRVSILRTEYESQEEKITHWLKAAAENVTRVHGSFPLKSTQVVVIPVNGRSNEAVPFGRVIRDGGEAVQFFVNTRRPLDEFTGDWTATHEFSHLLFPYVEDRWVSEGLASYYQNVLMARGKEYTPRRAWQKLYEGFERGKRSAPGMSPHSATFGNGGLMKVYWSGAVLALIADVKLRELSDGRESLDTVVRQLRYCCLPSRKIYSDRDFFIELDRHTEHKIFKKLYDEYAHSAGFPNWQRVFSTLGIAVSGARVKLVEADGKAIRDAIMQGPATPSG